LTNESPIGWGEDIEIDVDQEELIEEVKEVKLGHASSS
jgi:hypothetical protein